LTFTLKYKSFFLRLWQYLVSGRDYSFNWSGAVFDL
jgi:hypothetical protein